MSDKSKIDWTDATWQVTAGCTKVSPGCMNCYAATMAKRLRAMGLPAYQNVVTDKGQWTGWVGCLPGNLPIPLHWRKPRRIFVDSMSDLFHPSVPFEFIDRVFGVMALASWHTFQILTKRPERAAEYAATWGDGTKVDRIALAANQMDFRQGGLCERPLGHVWIGTTVENQAAADKRIPELLKIPAVVRFVSCEPLLGEIDLTRWLYSEHDRAGMDSQYLAPIGGNSTAKIGWVIAGGESGPNARPMHPNALRSLRDQCDEAGTPFFFEQWGEWAPFATHAIYNDGEELGGDCGGPGSITFEPHGMGTVTLRDGTRKRCQIAYQVPGHWWGRNGGLSGTYCRIGKKLAGRMLDGREWHEFPQPHPGEEL